MLEVHVPEGGVEVQVLSTAPRNGFGARVELLPNGKTRSSRTAATAGVGFIVRLAVAAREQVFRACFEGLGTRHKEHEGIGQSTDHVERETDRERTLDLLTRSAGGKDCSHVIRIHRVLAHQLAE